MGCPIMSTKKNPNHIKKSTNVKSQQLIDWDYQKIKQLIDGLSQPWGVIS